jgi:hypothetical protein
MELPDTFFPKFVVYQNNFSKVCCTRISCDVLYLAAKKPQDVRAESNPITGLDRPLGFQEVEASRFLDNRLR